MKGMGMILKYVLTVYVFFTYVVSHNVSASVEIGGI